MIIRTIFLSLLLVACVRVTIQAQVPMSVGVKILRAEDARRYDKPLEDLINSPDVNVRNRAVLAAGRIGNERAITALARLLKNKAAAGTAAMAAFAIGEIESMNGADPILEILGD